MSYPLAPVTWVARYHDGRLLSQVTPKGEVRPSTSIDLVRLESLCVVSTITRAVLVVLPCRTPPDEVVVTLITHRSLQGQGSSRVRRIGLRTGQTVRGVKVDDRGQWIPWVERRDDPSPG